VCINPCRVPDVVKLRGELKSSQSPRAVSKTSSVKIAAVCGFPLGANSAVIKAAEAADLIRMGCDEVDMVINVGALMDKSYAAVWKDISGVVRATERHTVKVILETCLLTETQIIDGCILSVLAGAQFVKTSTGFSTGGAKVSDVRLMKMTVGDSALVKASGGVRDFATAKDMADNGAARIGASASVAIVTSERSQRRPSSGGAIPSSSSSGPSAANQAQSPSGGQY